MIQSKIEKRYPELKGFSHNAQLNILKRAKREVFSTKRILCTILFCAMIIAVVYSIVQRVASLPESVISACVIGVLGGVFPNLHYAKMLRQKVKILIKSE